MEFGKKYIWIWIAALALTIVVGVHLFRIVFSARHKQAVELIQTQINYSVTQSKEVGSILAHDMKVLRTDMLSYNVFFDISRIKSEVWEKNLDTLCKSFSNILQEKSYQEYKSVLSKARKEMLKDVDRKKKSNNDNIKIRHEKFALNIKPVNNIQRLQLKELPILRQEWSRGGLQVEEVKNRKSSYANLALFTLGKSNVFREGYGIEQSLIDSINSLERFTVKTRKIKNATIQQYSSQATEDKLNVITTLDVAMQDVAEQLLIQKLKEHSELKWGCIVVMETATGEIRVCANKERSSNGMVEKDNYALRERVAPGSTFKLTTFMTLMEEANLGKEDMFTSSKGDKLTVQNIFERSLLAETKELFTHYFPTRKSEKLFLDRLQSTKIEQLKNFGIVNTISGEGKPYIPPFNKFKAGETFSDMCIGYQVGLTPLQTLSIFNAVANQGKMIQPVFIHGFEKGGEIIQLPLQVVNPSICSDKTRTDLIEMMEGVVARGTGKLAASHRFRVAGKTGTAMLMESKTSQGVEKLISFAGFYPADAPQYSTIVVFRSVPTRQNTYGGDYAAPVFGKIAEAVMSISSVCKKLENVSETKDYPSSKIAKVETLDANYKTLKIPFHYNETQGTWVKGNAADKVETLPVSVDEMNYPNTIGMGLSDALFILENKKFKVVAEGSGTVVEQQYKEGKIYLRLQ